MIKASMNKINHKVTRNTRNLCQRANRTSAPRTQCNNHRVALHDALSSPWEIHKIDKLCLTSPSDMTKCVDIAVSNAGTGLNKVVVMSILPDVKHVVCLMLEKAVIRDSDWKLYLNAIQHKHLVYANVLLGDSYEYDIFYKQLLSDVKIISDIVEAISIARTSVQFGNLVLSYTEIWSATMFSLACNQKLKKERSKKDSNCNELYAVVMDTRDVVVVNSTSPCVGRHNYDVDLSLSIENLEKWIVEHCDPAIIVATSNSSKNLYGRTTRVVQSSDYATTCDLMTTTLSRLFKSVHITFWTTMDGIYSANPSRVKFAFPLVKLTFKEAKSLGHICNDTDTNNLHFITVCNIYKTSGHGTVIYDEQTTKYKDLLPLPGVEDEQTTVDMGSKYSSVSGMSVRDNITTVCVRRNQTSTYTMDQKGGRVCQSELYIDVLSQLHASDIRLELVNGMFKEDCVTFAVSSDCTSDMILAALNADINDSIESIWDVTIIPECSIITVAGYIDANITECVIGAIKGYDVLAMSGGSRLRTTMPNYIAIVVNSDVANYVLNAIHDAYYYEFVVKN